MQMRILREPRATDATDRLPALDEITGLNLQAPAGQMAILRFPMFRVFDQGTVAAFDVADRLARRFVKNAVRHAIARAKNAAAGGSENLHAGPLRLQ
jgi:hypothetical protein